VRAVNGAHKSYLGSLTGFDITPLANPDKPDGREITHFFNVGSNNSGESTLSLVSIITTSTGRPNLENRIISLTYGDALP
jgi:hypothetical protein